MTPQEALNYAMRFVGNMPLTDTSLITRIMDDASKMLWMRAPWRWSLAYMSVVSLVNNTQDVATTVASDLLYIESCVARLDDEQWDIKPVAVLPVDTNKKGKPSQVTPILTGTPGLRFWPIPTGYTTLPKIYTIYKRKCSDITTGNQTTNLETTTGLPEPWHWVYAEILKYKAMDFANYPKAGNVTFVNGGTQHTGQLAIAEAAIAEMIRQEKPYFNALGLEVR